jgi:hypothetical protein
MIDLTGIAPLHFPICARCRRQVSELRLFPGFKSVRVVATCHGETEEMELTRQILDNPDFELSRGVAFQDGRHSSKRR